jgi:hypothetical protein
MARLGALLADGFREVGANEQSLGKAHVLSSLPLDPAMPFR